MFQNGEFPNQRRNLLFLLPSNGTEVGKDGAYQKLQRSCFGNELLALAQTFGLDVEDTKFISAMSGSDWFDQHRLALGTLFSSVALHDVRQFPS